MFVFATWLFTYRNQSFQDPTCLPHDFSRTGTNPSRTLHVCHMTIHVQEPILPGPYMFATWLFTYRNQSFQDPTCLPHDYSLTGTNPSRTLHVCHMTIHVQEPFLSGPCMFATWLFTYRNHSFQDLACLPHDYSRTGTNPSRTLHVCYMTVYIQEPFLSGPCMFATWLFTYRNQSVQDLACLPHDYSRTGTNPSRTLHVCHMTIHVQEPIRPGPCMFATYLFTYRNQSVHDPACSHVYFETKHFNLLAL